MQGCRGAEVQRCRYTMEVNLPLLPRVWNGGAGPQPLPVCAGCGTSAPKGS